MYAAYKFFILAFLCIERQGEKREPPAIIMMLLQAFFSDIRMSNMNPIYE